ncbi:hypothetical protein [Chelativorans sp. AA-79]|uniref:hypothetical protein n=1 Tax=Chelativorans sp. AA-79 TaxID=3028735 RepID=UPI0023F97DF3|nr:hypothetical protein [Chelativorans sp. AA-79]WEX07191.1 hypothetical protein PVE73_13690 [Chelativorans sp. AA-79]
MAGAFDKRQGEDGLWEVYDEDSDEVILIDGLPLAGLGEEEADDALRRLRRGDLSPDYSPEAP